MLPQGAGFRKMTASSTEKALLLAHHPFRADQGFPGYVPLQAQEAILEEGLTELLLHQLLLGQDCGGQQLADDEEMLWPTRCRRTVLVHLSVTTRDHQELEQEEPCSSHAYFELIKLRYSVDRPGGQ